MRRFLLLTALITLCVPALSGAEPEPSVAVRPSGILVAGRPFFPAMIWAACPADVEQDLVAGINVFMGYGEHCTTEADLLSAVAGRAYVVPSINDGTNLLASPSVIGYHQPDEPDGYGIPPESLARVPNAPVFLTLTPHFAQEQDPISDTITKAVYPRYIAKADVIGFDLYPLSHFCHQERIRLSSVYSEQRDLVRLARGKPTFQWLETGAQEGSCGPTPITGAQLQTEAWLAIAAGARGLGYFTYGWPGGVISSFSTTADVVAAMTETNREIQRLAPILLAPTIATVFSTRRAQIKIGGRRAGPVTYVIAVNPAATPRAWSRALPGLGTQKVAVVGENRWVQAVRGRIKDAFSPYSKHIYAWKTVR